MTVYGVVPEGFSRKPLEVILSEMENQLITEFGPDVIQTAQSPFGQINGLMSDLITELWELAEDIYQSYDPDQAEGTRLDTLASIRLIGRQTSELDPSFRLAITNQGQARIDLQDISRAIAEIDGVTYYHVWTNNQSFVDDNGMPPGSVCIAVTGGDDDEIALAIRTYIVPGVVVFGNTRIESSIDGYCRSTNILRPIDVPVQLEIKVRTFRDGFGCPPPSSLAIKAAFLQNVRMLNGDDVSFYKVRSVIENSFTNVEVILIKGSRDDIDQSENLAVVIAFIERASFADNDVDVVVT